MKEVEKLKQDLEAAKETLKVLEAKIKIAEERFTPTFEDILIARGEMAKGHWYINTAGDGVMSVRAPNTLTEWLYMGTTWKVRNFMQLCVLAEYYNEKHPPCNEYMYAIRYCGGLGLVVTMSSSGVDKIFSSKEAAEQCMYEQEKLLKKILN